MRVCTCLPSRDREGVGSKRLFQQPVRPVARIRQVRRGVAIGFNKDRLREMRAGGQRHSLFKVNYEKNDLLARLRATMAVVTEIHGRISRDVSDRTEFWLTQLSQLGTSETGSAFVFNRGIPKVSTTFRAGEKRRWLRC